MNVHCFALFVCMITPHLQASPHKPVDEDNNSTEENILMDENEETAEHGNSEGSEIIAEQSKPEEKNATQVQELTDGDGRKQKPTRKEYGEMGNPVVLYGLSAEEQKKMQQQYKLYDFNEYVSEKISVHRKLPDARDYRCKEPGRYASALPPTSVIICFHNEAWSVLLRTIHSVLHRTKHELLEEIILIDDFSNMDHLKKRLDDYVNTLEKVRIFHTEERMGKGRCRTLGASMAKANVLTFLDSHCEVTKGWIEPLLDTLHRNPTAVVLPVIEDISPDTFQTFFQGCDYLQIGGMNLGLLFMWRPIPAKDRNRRHMCDNVNTPTMTGGLFTISKKFFQSIGYCDEPMDVWGAEHIEFSLKIWMCGGSIELVPCSRVGHLFRRTFYPVNVSHTSTSGVSRNLAKVAEVWLEHRSTYYYSRGGGKRIEGMDLRDALKLKTQLGCKNFDWYLTHVYPEMFIPDQAPAFGDISNLVDSNYCIDSYGGKHNTQPGVFECHHQGGNQHWFLSPTGEIRTDSTCLEYTFDRGFLMTTCDNNRYLQSWIYNPTTNEIIHPFTKRCLSMDSKTKKLCLVDCAANESIAKWKFKHQFIDKIWKTHDTM